jgi:putative membrane protein
MGAALRLMVCGVAIGLAVVLPGVSGGTFAIMFGVYDRLLDIITPDVKKIARSWRFWAPLLAGALAGVLLFSRLMGPLFASFPAPASWFFMGLVAGSLPMLYFKKARWFNGASWLCCLAGLCVMVIPVVLGTPLAASMASGADSFPPVTPLVFAQIAGAVALGTFAMIIPGLSGSNVLIVLGVYLPLLDGVNTLRAGVLAASVVGGAAGLLLGAKLVRALLHRFGAQTYGAILGLVAGSLAVIYPLGWGLGPGLQWIASILCFVAGCFLTGKFGTAEKSPG